MADLSTLRDIHLPPDPLWWPPAPGWWLIAALIFLLILLRSYLRRRFHRFINRQRSLSEFRRIRRRLKGNTDPTNQAQAMADLSELMRRIAHTRLRPEYKTTLTGPQWLQFLTDTSQDNNFREDPGRHLIRSPYEMTSRLSDGQVAGLIHQCKRWLNEHA